MKAPAWLPYLFIAALLFGAAATYSASAENGKWEYMEVFVRQNESEFIVEETTPSGGHRETVVTNRPFLAIASQRSSELGAEGWECYSTTPVSGQGTTFGTTWHFRRRKD